MSEALFDLERVLRSQQEKLTPREVNVLLTCRAKAIQDFTVGACVASGVVWMATRRLNKNKFFRINLSIGVAAISGMWRFGRSLDSCLDRILALDGSRMQKELANIIVNKYRDDPWRMQLISKHFYSEKVFDDSTLDQPKLRWRYRNFFGDNVAYGQRTHDSDSHSDSDSKKTDLELKQVSVNHSVDAMADPLDCVFGYSGTSEEIRHPDASSTKPRVLNRSHRRSHRRHRMRHHEASSNSQHA